MILREAITVAAATKASNRDTATAIATTTVSELLDESLSGSETAASVGAIVVCVGGELNVAFRMGTCVGTVTGGRVVGTKTGLGGNVRDGGAVGLPDACRA